MLFILTILGTMEIGMVLSTEAPREGSVRDAARFGVTGQDEAERLSIIQDITSPTGLSVSWIRTGRRSMC